LFGPDHLQDFPQGFSRGTVAPQASWHTHISIVCLSSLCGCLLMFILFCRRRFPLRAGSRRSLHPELGVTRGRTVGRRLGVVPPPLVVTIFFQTFTFQVMPSFTFVPSVPPLYVFCCRAVFKFVCIFAHHPSPLLGFGTGPPIRLPYHDCLEPPWVVGGVLSIMGFLDTHFLCGMCMGLWETGGLLLRFLFVSSLC